METFRGIYRHLNDHEQIYGHMPRVIVLLAAVSFIQLSSDTGDTLGASLGSSRRTGFPSLVWDLGELLVTVTGTIAQSLISGRITMRDRCETDADGSA
jgi:hypothetical protein